MQPAFETKGVFIHNVNKKSHNLTSLSKYLHVHYPTTFKNEWLLIWPSLETVLETVVLTMR